ncbi:hypothetical protein [Leptospira ilyithenensis]|uniref:Uncharacterized protein n=1 Tax=Leptospira ilyithenensis TaxID=2484901 RepID=A0A4R9LR10_9LEPT|nr:hypothetical protein [Leptospira ilyithenensis]TGN10566.1 hypothetical protein EHS11_09785 [Leptospira ilyithenensis]
MKLINFLVCDDVRTEKNGKNIFIGVYDDIIVEATSEEKLVYLKLFFIFRFMDVQSDNYKFDLNFLMDGSQYHSMSGTLPIGKLMRHLTLNIGVDQFPIKSFGELSIELKLTNSQNVKFKFSPEYKINISKQK